MVKLFNLCLSNWSFTCKFKNRSFTCKYKNMSFTCKYKKLFLIKPNNALCSTEYISQSSMTIYVYLKNAQSMKCLYQVPIR